MWAGHSLALPLAFSSLSSLPPKSHCRIGTCLAFCTQVIENCMLSLSWGLVLLLKGRGGVFLPALQPTHEDMLHAAIQAGSGSRTGIAPDLLPAASLCERLTKHRA